MLLVAILAILIIAIIGYRQARAHHQGLIAAQEHERQLNSRNLAMSLDAIARETADSIMFAVKGLNSPQKVHDIANGTRYFRRDGVAIHQHSLQQIPFYQILYPNLIRLGLNLAGMASQVQDATETILRVREMMDKEAFDAFFNEMDQMASSADDIARAIHHEVENIRP